MKGMSLSSLHNVFTCTTPIQHIEPKPIPKPSIIEVPSDDAHLQCTLYPLPNSELCYYVDSLPNPSESLLQCHHNPTPLKELTEDKILEKCHMLYPDVSHITGVLSYWVHHGRENEVDKPLINALLFLDHDLAVSVLQQLRQPHAQLAMAQHPHKIWKIDGNSVIILLMLTTLMDSTTHAVDTLLDCGASGLGYLHHNWVIRNNIPMKTLPYLIPVYNADGTLNKSGSITHTCDLVVTINNHIETLTFVVTNTGSSDAILGLSWLRFYNPLVNWCTGNICFTTCPSACSLVPLTPHGPCINMESDCGDSVVQHGPDGDHLHCLEEYPTLLVNLMTWMLSSKNGVTFLVLNYSLMTSLSSVWISTSVITNPLVMRLIQE